MSKVYYPVEFFKSDKYNPLMEKVSKVVPVFKPLGWTPLKAVTVFKSKNPKYRNETISYAGRLDPMAEGVLLLLVEDENKKRKEYEGLKKEYEAEIVFGITTDSFDALGLIDSVRTKIPKPETVIEVLKSYVGKQLQKYPPYSSKPVDGKPLYFWARKNKLSEIVIPEKQIEIFSISIKEDTRIQISELLNIVEKKINAVEGDFRQEKILKTWKEFSLENEDNKVSKISVTISCSSGTYVRQLASDLGEKAGTGAFALSIKRTKVGKFSEKECVQLL